MIKKKLSLFFFYILGFMTHYIISKTMRNKEKESQSKNNSSVATQSDFKEKFKPSQDSCKQQDSSRVHESENYDLVDEMHESNNSDYSSDCIKYQEEYVFKYQEEDDFKYQEEYVFKYQEEDDFKNKQTSEFKSYYQKLGDLLYKKKTNKVSQETDNLKSINETDDLKSISKNDDLKLINETDDLKSISKNDDLKSINETNDFEHLVDELINPILSSIDAFTQTDTVINSEVQTSKHIKLIRKVSRDSELRSYVEDDLLTTVCKLEDKDYPFIFSLIPEYIKTGVIFLPQNNILTEILKKGIKPDQEYSSSIFKMGYRKLYTVLCTFLHCKEEFSTLELMCKPEYKNKVSSEDIIVTFANIKKSFKLGQDPIIRFPKVGKFLEQLYHPMTPEQILNYKFNNPISKDIFMNSNIMREMDSKILLSNGKNLKISILDYLIISFDKINKKISL